MIPLIKTKIQKDYPYCNLLEILKNETLITHKFKINYEITR